jgi:hypothetical protein
MYKTIGQVATYKRLSSCNLEELAAHQLGVDPSGGILFARKPDGDEKIKARQLVLDIFSAANWNRSLNMLTLPGLQWRFERLLLAAREPGWMKRPRSRHTHFTGVENDRAIYYSGVGQMPGVETPNRLIKPVRRDGFPFAEMAHKTRFASFFFANVDDLLAHEWKKPTYRETEKSGWDAAWLDYTGPLTVDRLKVIARFYQTYVREVLVVTSLKARWNKITGEAILKAGGHSAWLAKSLPGEVLHDIEYFDTSPMAQFAVRHAEPLERELRALEGHAP